MQMPASGTNVAVVFNAFSFHKDCPSVVSVLATCPAVEHHNGWQRVLSLYDLCITWALPRLRDRLFGLEVKASVWGAEDPGFKFRF